MPAQWKSYLPMPLVLPAVLMKASVPETEARARHLLEKVEQLITVH